MTDPIAAKSYSVDDIVRAQRALRELSGLSPEMFPIQAFVGMISDEIENLRKQGHSDQEIARTIEANSSIRITASEIGSNYASPSERHSGHE